MKGVDCTQAAWLVVFVSSPGVSIKVVEVRTALESLEVGLWEWFAKTPTAGTPTYNYEKQQH